MQLKHLMILGVAIAASTGMAAGAQTAQTPVKHATHHAHHARTAVQRTSREATETRDLNSRELTVATGAGVQPIPTARAGEEPVSRAMYQRVPGANPLHSATAAGGVAHPGGPPIAHN